MNERPSATVIIPAHNEARVIARALRTLTSSSDDNEFDVVVVCNGCSDSTQEAAGSLGRPDVRVVAIEESSKSRAMNVGDSIARTYPRLYLDADVELSTEGARHMVEALRTSPSVVASPQYRLDGCTPLAQSYWLEWQRRNANPRSGTGCFGLSEAARTTFGDFPELLGDDQWIASVFSPEVVEAAVTQVRVARTIRAVLKRRVRIARGNRELVSRGAPSGDHSGGTGGISRRFVGVALLVGIHGLASVRARLQTSGTWAQDDSSRRADPVTVP